MSDLKILGTFDQNGKASHTVLGTRLKAEDGRRKTEENHPHPNPPPERGREFLTFHVSLFTFHFLGVVRGPVKAGVRRLQSTGPGEGAIFLIYQLVFSVAGQIVDHCHQE